MLKKIKRFFDERIAPSSDTQSVDHQIQLATAALLIELMKSDDAVAAEERLVIEKIVFEKFSLTQEETQSLMLLAEEEVKQAVDLFQFTSEINANFSAEMKIGLVENLWHVAFADGMLDKYEEALIRQVAELLHVPHADFIAAKHRASNATH